MFRPRLNRKKRLRRASAPTDANLNEPGAALPWDLDFRDEATDNPRSKPTANDEWLDVETRPGVQEGNDQGRFHCAEPFPDVLVQEPRADQAHNLPKSLDFRRKPVSPAHVPASPPSASSNTIQLPDSSRNPDDLHGNTSPQSKLDSSPTFSTISDIDNLSGLASPPRVVRHDTHRSLLRSSTWASSPAALSPHSPTRNISYALGVMGNVESTTKDLSSVYEYDDEQVLKSRRHRCSSPRRSFQASKNDLDHKLSPFSPAFTPSGDTFVDQQISPADSECVYGTERLGPFDMCPHCEEIIKDFFRSPYTAVLNMSPEAARLWRHFFALLIFLIFGLGPLGSFVLTPGHQHTLRYDKTQVTDSETCGPYGYQSYSSSDGMELLFTVDLFWGQMQYWMVKLIDIIYDTAVGFGMQAISWFICYRVFGDSLLRTIEFSPTSFRTFFALSLDAGTYSSVRALFQDLSRHTTRRAKLRVVCMALCAVWVLSIPTMFGAMTGYTPAQKAYVRTDAFGLVPKDAIVFAYSGHDTARIGIPNNTCFQEHDDRWQQYLQQSRAYCKACRCFDDVKPWQEYMNEKKASPECLYCARIYNHEYSVRPGYGHRYLGKDKGKHHSKEPPEDNSAIQNRTCTQPVTLTVSGQQWELGDKPIYEDTLAQCYKGSPLGGIDPWGFINHRGTCMQRSENPVYAWGFSITFTFIALVIHTVWGATMYIIWLDADFNSRLVQRGYRLSEMRAVFALGAAANRTLGVNDISDVRDISGKEIEERLKRANVAVLHDKEDSDLPFVQEVRKWEEGDEKEKEKSTIRQRNIPKKSGSISSLPLYDNER